MAAEGARGGVGDGGRVRERWRSGGRTVPGGGAGSDFGGRRDSAGAIRQRPRVRYPCSRRCRGEPAVSGGVAGAEVGGTGEPRGQRGRRARAAGGGPCVAGEGSP